MECYIKINSNLFYKISKGNCQGVNTVRRSFKNHISLPSAYIKDVTVISKEEYEQAKKQIGL